jgi:hypothetical protein
MGCGIGGRNAVCGDTIELEFCGCCCIEGLPVVASVEADVKVLLGINAIMGEG